MINHNFEAWLLSGKTGTYWIIGDEETENGLWITKPMFSVKHGRRLHYVIEKETRDTLITVYCDLTAEKPSTCNDAVNLVIDGLYSMADKLVKEEDTDD